jgi:hypothetical protein
MQIPADAMDDDVLVLDYIKEQRANRPVPENDNIFLYASKYAGCTFNQAAAVAAALTHKGWKIPSSESAAPESAEQLAVQIAAMLTGPDYAKNRKALELAGTILREREFEAVGK